MKTTTSIQTGIVMLALAASSPSFAGVQFRIGHEASSNKYVVYMTPDSTPSPDMVLSSQVTLVVPHKTGASRFQVNNISSAVQGINWENHSRVNAPAENPKADYLSFGLVYTGSSVPVFGWQKGKEKRLFSFKSPSGCVAGVALLDNNDPFNQLPNSVNTNPGNEFSNIGWLSGNAYTGNYGGNVNCAAVTPPPACTQNPANLEAINQEIQGMSALINTISPVSKRTKLQKKLTALSNTLQGS
jgi:hypothetical protein